MAILSLLHGYPDYVGKRFVFCGTYTGPKSYATGGDTVTLPGFQNYIDSIENSAGLSVSGTYIFRAIPSAAGARPTWKVKWYTAAAPQTEVSAATDLSGESFIISGLGGVY
jgi:hypothetical protein